MYTLNIKIFPHSLITNLSFNCNEMKYQFKILVSIIFIKLMIGKAFTLHHLFTYKFVISGLTFPDLFSKINLTTFFFFFFFNSSISSLEIFQFPNSLITCVHFQHYVDTPHHNSLGHYFFSASIKWRLIWLSCQNIYFYELWS